MSRADRIAEAAEAKRDRIGGEEQDALMVEYIGETEGAFDEDDFEEWLMSRLTAEAEDDCTESETRDCL